MRKPWILSRSVVVWVCWYSRREISAILSITGVTLSFSSVTNVAVCKWFLKFVSGSSGKRKAHITEKRKKRLYIWSLAVTMKLRLFTVFSYQKDKECDLTRWWRTRERTTITTRIITGQLQQLSLIVLSNMNDLDYNQTMFRSSVTLESPLLTKIKNNASLEELMDEEQYHYQLNCNNPQLIS